jgi:ribosomal protein S18 acetylase RimI-like enzyme
MPICLPPSGHGTAAAIELSANRKRLMLSPAGIVEEFCERWIRSDLRHVMPEPGVLPNGPLVELTSIGVHKKHQRHGYASRALRMLTALCDANAMTIKLVARPLEDDLLPGCPATLSTEELVAWYEKHGFVETSGAGDDTREMIREPRMPR